MRFICEGCGKLVNETEVIVKGGDYNGTTYFYCNKCYEGNEE